MNSVINILLFPFFSVESELEELNSGRRGGVQLITDRRQGVSRLEVTNVTWRDAGNYTCDPRDATAANVYVHIIDGK